MRFAIAVGILSQALPASSDPTNANILLGASDERKQRIQSPLQEPADRQSDLFSTLKKGRKPAGLSVLKNKKRRFKNGALKNEAIISEDAVACDPSSTADVGLLSCGVGKYCVESQNSKLGGSCVSSMQLTTNRHLQDGNVADYYCNPNSDSYQTIPCDCAEFDLSTLTGAIECTYNYGCLEPICNDTCFDLSLYYSKDEEGIEFGFCYNSYSPSEESFCIDYSYSLDGVATSCSASLDGEDCGPCELGPSMYDGEQCAFVDCTSVGGLARNQCDDILVPILQECVDDYGIFCDICAGGNVTDLFANATIPDYGDISCFALVFAGAFGEIPDAYCPAYQGYAAEPCCGESEIVTPPPSPDAVTSIPTAAPADPAIFVCQICGEGKAITKPDGAVLIPTQPERTCAEIQAGAEAGGITTVQCPLISSFVNEPCGCEDVMPTEPPAPTDAPGVVLTDAPVVVPTDAPGVVPTDVPVVVPTPAPTDGGSTPPPSPEAVTSIPTATPADPAIFVCQICGEGKAITKPDGAVLIPTQPERTCAEIQAGAEVGGISTELCSLISNFVNEPCGCEDVMPTEPPAPTDAPVVVPTDAPVVVPTDAPVVAPTPAPTDGGSGLLSVKNAASLVGLSMTMVFYFAG